MPKLRAVLSYGLLVVFLISLTGCGLISNQAAETETADTFSEAGLPEWLLLSYRSNRGLLAEEDKELLLPKDAEEDEEDEEEPAEPEPALETAAPAPADQASQPAPASTPAESATPDEEEEEESRSLTKSQEMLAESWKRRQAQNSDDEEEDDDNGGWWNPSTENNFKHDFFD